MISSGRLRPMTPGVDGSGWKPVWCRVGVVSRSDVIFGVSMLIFGWRRGSGDTFRASWRCNKCHVRSQVILIPPNAEALLQQLSEAYIA